MAYRAFVRLLMLLVGLGVGVCGHSALSRSFETNRPIDEFMKRREGVSQWEVARELKWEGGRAYVLRMTSQRWRSRQEVDRPVWRHWLTVIVPDRVNGRTGFVFVTGGKHQNHPPDKVDESMARIAGLTGSVVTLLPNVPNQPLVFADSPDTPRVEDDILAYSWNRAMDTGDTSWIAQFAMAKSVVRAMDTVQAFLKQKTYGTVQVDDFVIAGASKRGWTTWLTAVVDERVVAIVPIVIDLLNLQPSMRHHFAAYGFWSPALYDYSAHKILDRFESKEYAWLLGHVDPFAYRHRLIMPKFLINSAGDPFFLNDSWRFYYAELIGEKHIRYVPNTGHGLEDSDALESLVAFYDSVLEGVPRPDYEWAPVGENGIRVECRDPPVEVRLWQATNPEARDFRVDRLGKVWSSRLLTPLRPGVFEVKMSEPPQGWTAFFVEMTFKNGKRYPFKFTTGVRVVPDRVPFADRPLANIIEPDFESKQTSDQ